MPDPVTVARPWIDAYPPGVPPEYPIPVVALTRLLDDAVRDFPTRDAVRFGGTTTSWSGLGERVAVARDALVAAGLGPGSRVGVVAPNVPGAVAAMFGAWRIGAVVVLVDPRLPDVEVEALLERAGVQVLVGARGASPRLASIAARLSSRPSVVVTDPAAWLDVRSRVRWAVPRAGERLRWRPGHLRTPALPEGVTRLEDDVARAGAAASAEAVVAPDATAVVVFTAGTSGRRKGVMLSHRALVANAFQARLWIPDARAGHERVLCALPFSHAYGLTTGLLASTLMAATMVLPDRLRPGELLALIEAEATTLVPGSPALYKAMVSDPRVHRRDLRSIRVCVSGASALPPELATEFDERSGGARLREGYGLCEAGPLTHANPVYGRTTPGAIGLPVTSTVAVVVDPRDPTRVLEPGTIGELAVHGPQLMQGYLDDDVATAKVLRDGWLLTGDLVVQEPGGVFRLAKGAGHSSVHAAVHDHERHDQPAWTTLGRILHRRRRDRDREAHT